MENSMVEVNLDEITIDDIVLSEEGKNFTTSRIIARAFGKEHKNVLRDIENLECSEAFNRLNFEPVEYKDAKGEMRPAYRLTRDGFAFLAMGFTGKKAAAWKEKFLEAFNAMEKALLERETGSVQHSEITIEKTEPVMVPARLVPFRRWNKITPQMLVGLKGLLRFESYLQDIPVLENVNELLRYYRVEKLEELPRKNYQYILLAIIHRLFFVTNKSGEGTLSTELKSVMEGIWQFWYTISENARENIETYTYNKCGIKSLDEVQTDMDALKVILALWSGISIDMYK